MLLRGLAGRSRWQQQAAAFNGGRAATLCPTAPPYSVTCTARFRTTFRTSTPSPADQYIICALHFCNSGMFMVLPGYNERQLSVS